MKYEEIADENHLDFKTKVIYVWYMRTRWADTEEQKCSDGYATKWSIRFYNHCEFECSDHEGQNLLNRASRVLEYLFPKEKF